MKTKAFFALSLMVLIGFSLMLINAGRAVAVPALYVFNPLTQAGVTGASVGETFTVDVRVRDVHNLVGYDFFLKYNTTLLEFVSASEGPFLNSSSTYRSIFSAKYPGMPTWPFSDKIYVIASIIAPTLSSSASGTGTLASVAFKVLVEGSGILDLQDSILAKYDPFTPKPITHTSEDGYFTTGSVPRVVVEPAEVFGILPGDNFNVNISAIDVLNAYNWTVKMKWANKGLLNATNILEGSFLSDAGATAFTSLIDQDNGVLYINNTLTGDPLDGVSGNGTLATITFNVETKGMTDLELFDVKLYKQDGSVSPAAVESGAFSNTYRDVSIIDASVAVASVSKGDKVDITVTVKNDGEQNETFTVRVDFDSQAVGSKSVSKLVPDATQILAFQWDTANVEPKTYTLKALIVEAIPGETAEDRVDNTRTIGTVTVSGTGFDFNMWLLIGGVVVAVVVIAIVAFFFLRRRK